MGETKDVLPELGTWNNGRGIEPLDYFFCVAASLSAVASIDLFWPKFVEFDGYVLRQSFSQDNLRAWESSPSGHDRAHTERAVNFLDIGSLFQNSGEPDSEQLNARIDLMRRTLAEIYRVKLARDFPHRRFQVVLIDDEDDCALTFSQA
jgi:hypothetical protein